MFHHGLRYRLAYTWLMEDASEKTFRPGNDLQYKTTRLRDLNVRTEWFGLGAVRAWTTAYLQWKWKQKDDHPDRAIAVKAYLSYKINNGNKWHQEELCYRTGE